MIIPKFKIKVTPEESNLITNILFYKYNIHTFYGVAPKKDHYLYCKDNYISYGQLWDPYYRSYEAEEITFKEFKQKYDNK
jgi:hypothetical protein